MVHTLMYGCQPCGGVFHNAERSRDNHSMNWDIVRANLAVLIEARDISHTKLAAETGVPQPTISRFLSGTNNSMELENLHALARALDSSVSALLGEIPLVADAKIARVARVMETMAEYKKDAVVAVVNSLVDTKTRNGSGQ